MFASGRSIEHRSSWRDGPSNYRQVLWPLASIVVVVVVVVVDVLSKASIRVGSLGHRPMYKPRTASKQAVSGIIQPIMKYSLGRSQKKPSRVTKVICMNEDHVILSGGDGAIAVGD